MIIVDKSGKTIQFNDSYVERLKRRALASKTLTKDEEADYKLIIESEKGLRKR